MRSVAYVARSAMIVVGVSVVSEPKIATSTSSTDVVESPLVSVSGGVSTTRLPALSSDAFFIASLSGPRRVVDPDPAQPAMHVNAIAATDSNLIPIVGESILIIIGDFDAEAS